ncbi:tyrosine-protein phosphatase non-receptor type substrate 1-like [Caloenas nicobarica]|uniref:tyrosine-protein phosphatase non-receptor type substrate 1-like n=1 Tax=Caloenas nicobarica TaxID=187106 RepID=UPI0032B7F85A
MAPVTQALPLACLMLLLLRRAPGADAQTAPGFQLRQPQDKVSVTAGGTLTLTCTTSRDGPAGPVKWLKGWGSGNVTVYDQKGSLPRVTRAVNGSSTDWTIHIRDVQPEDSGTYYCAKFSKSLHGDEMFQRGGGTEVSVQAKPSTPVVSGPGRRAGPRQSLPFTCTSGGFFPEDISVKWLKDKAPIAAQPPQITPGRMKSSFDMSSTVTVTLQESDIRSQLVCEVQHPTLKYPLDGTYPLRRALRVSPRVQVVLDPSSPVNLNQTVNFTCHVKGFYPRDVTVTWLENGTELKVENVSRAVETPQGLFELRSLVEVQATEEKNGSTFTCRVVHNAQDPVTRTATLRIVPPAQEGPEDLPQQGVTLLASHILWLGILLEKGLLGGLLIFLFKRGRA